MLRNIIRKWLFVVIGIVLFVGAEHVVGKGSASDGGAKDPLVEERNQLSGEIRLMRERIFDLRARERKLQEGYRDIFKSCRKLTDPANVDEDTGKIILRIKKLESEANELRGELKERLKNHPQTLRVEKDMQKIEKDIMVLRKEEADIGRQKISKVGRLRIIEEELRKRRESAAAGGTVAESSKKADRSDG